MAPHSDRFGPLEQLWSDSRVSEIFIYSPDHIVTAVESGLEQSPLRFNNEDHLRAVLQGLAASCGLDFGLQQPVLEVKLANHWRLHAICPPMVVGSPIAALHAPLPLLSMDDLLEQKVLSAEALDVLQTCITARLNIVISGNRGGKTTLLNALASFVSAGERIITVEAFRELRLAQPMVMSLEVPRADLTRMSEVVRMATHMKPDRLIVGEIAGAEALDLVLEMSTGRRGVMSTLLASSPRDALYRLETLSQFRGDYPVRAIREGIAAGVHLVLNISRLRDGSRCVTQITEVRGIEGDIITTEDLFVLRETAPEQWNLTATDVRPSFMKYL